MKNLNIKTLSPEVKLGNPKLNKEIILDLINKNIDAHFLLFPELSITGYSCGDLFNQPTLIEEAKNELISLIKEYKSKSIIIIGTPLYIESSLYNCAVVLKDNKVIGIIPKTYLPVGDEFFENRWFEESTSLSTNKFNFLSNDVVVGNILFTDNDLNISFGVEICEDAYALVPPSSYLVSRGANIIFNLSASPTNITKNQVRSTLVNDLSRRYKGLYVYTSTSSSESTESVVYNPHQIAYIGGEKLLDDNKTALETKINNINVNIDKLLHLSLSARHNFIFNNEVNTVNISIPKIDFKLKK